jgi:hypothetical protein
MLVLERAVQVSPTSAGAEPPSSCGHTHRPRPRLHSRPVDNESVGHATLLQRTMIALTKRVCDRHLGDFAEPALVFGIATRALRFHGSPGAGVRSLGSHPSALATRNGRKSPNPQDRVATAPVILIDQEPVTGAFWDETPTGDAFSSLLEKSPTARVATVRACLWVGR